MSKFFGMIAFVTFVLVAPSLAQSGLSVSDVEAIRSLQAGYRQAWLRNDEAAVLSVIDETATLYPSGSAPVRGKAAIRKFWFAPSDTVTAIEAFDDVIEEITGDGNFAAMTGTNTIHWSTSKKNKSDLKRFISKSTFIALLARRGDEWKIVKQIWHGKTEEIK